jgi:hypothetical protein
LFVIPLNISSADSFFQSSESTFDIKVKI